MAADLSPLDPAVPAAGSKIRWSSLHGSARGLALACMARKAEAPVLVIAPDSGAAHRIESELAFYLDAPDPETAPPEATRIDSGIDRYAGKAEILRFPDWETLPYDHFLAASRTSCRERLARPSMRAYPS